MEKSNNNLLYLTSPQKRCFLIHPQTYIGKYSRGTGKSTRIMAMRSMRIAMDVPRSVNCFYGATYIGLHTRTLPSTLSGWNEFGWKAGRDYVINVEPPSRWPKPYDFEPLTYKNTITTRYGSIFVLGSNDRPGLVNSLSITGQVLIDEFRFIDINRMQVDLLPAIRGNYRRWLNNPHVFSLTITTDQPFPDEEAYQYLKNLENKTDQEQIKLIALMSLSYEETKRKHLEAKANGDDQYLIERLERKKNYLNKIRAKSTYFDSGSILSNLTVLGTDYLTNNTDGRMSDLIVKTSFLNIEPDEVENKFYAQLRARHFIKGEFDYNHIDKAGIDPNFKMKAEYILDYSPDMPVDIEFDFGDLCSCSISQTFGNEERYIATFEVILPFDIDDLVSIVADFMSNHRNRIINLYKDPSGNYNKNKKGQTYGPQTIIALKQYDWHIIDKTPVGSINPSHNAKIQLINDILKEKYPHYPIVRIIRDTNQPLEASLKRAPRDKILRHDGTFEIIKVKKSERKTKLQDKPGGQTTDHSDHFDIKIWHKYHHLMGENNGLMAFDIT